MRISDWSSDVCCSDLVLRRQSPRSVAARWRLSPNIFDHCASLSRARSWVFPAGIAVAPDLAARITACRAAIACDQRETAGNEARPTSSSPLACTPGHAAMRSEEHTSELQSLMRNSYAV